MKALALAVCGGLGLLAAIIILSNWSLVLREYTGKPGARVPSRIPIAGGLLGSLAILIYVQLPVLPRQTWSWWILLPLALDPGGVPFFLVELGCVVIAQRVRRLASLSRRA